MRALSPSVFETVDADHSEQDELHVDCKSLVWSALPSRRSRLVRLARTSRNGSKPFGLPPRWLPVREGC